MSSGAMAVIRFNWPMYALAALVIVAALFVSSWISAVAATVAIYFSGASIIASFAVYDASALTQWRWLVDFVPPHATHIANVNAGFDDTSDAIPAVFPGAMLDTFVFDDPSRRMTRSIERAKKFRPARDAQGFSGAAPNSFDAVLFLFAAHEIRDAAERERFFRAVAATLRDNGRIIVVEHLRDFANALVYGPGAWHFYSRREWLRVGSAAGLSLIAELQKTPFVRAFVFAKARYASPR